MIESIYICELFALLTFGSFRSLCNANHRPPLPSEAMISHTYNLATMENLYPCHVPLHNTEGLEWKRLCKCGIVLSKTKTPALHCGLYYYRNTAGLQNGQERIGSRWSNISGMGFKVASCVVSYLLPRRPTSLSLSQERENKSVRGKRKPPPDLNASSSASKQGQCLCAPFVEGCMTSPAGGAALKSDFFIVHW